MYKNENHPLHLDPVLQSLFDQLEISDIKNCRLVNQQWAGKAFHSLRGKVIIKLGTMEKRKKFLTSIEGQSLKFLGFPFEIADWDESIALYLTTIGPKQLSLNITLDADTNNTANSSLQSLLVTYYKKLTKLDFRIRGVLSQLYIPPAANVLSSNCYSQLTSLIVKSYNNTVEIPELGNLWISIIKHSPRLKHLELAWENNEFWSEVCQLATFGNLESLALPVMSSVICRCICRIQNINLKRLIMKFEPEDCDLILRRVSHSLEELTFITPNESALSPINFPVMLKLKILNSGSSQLSFPSINQVQLPLLDEIIVTYWDWVYTFEQLPDVHYYWRTEDAHTGITKITIKFPSLSNITGNYQTMENYSDFCVRIAQKFQSLNTIRFKNLTINPSTNRNLLHGAFKVKDTAESLGPRLKEITVIDYDKDMTEPHSSDLMSIVNSTSIGIEIWDLNPLEWLKVWTGNISSTLDYRHFNMIPDIFLQLRIVKLLWVAEINLSDFVQKLPALELFEIIGGRCIDRFDRRNMKKLRPHMIYIQHTCCCPTEDEWFMSDSNSGETFERLYSNDGLTI